MSYVVTVTSSDMSTHINNGIDVLLDAMEKDGLITEKQHGDMLSYRIVVHEPGFWGTLWRKLWKDRKNDAWLYSTVRLSKHITDIEEFKDACKEEESKDE